MMEDGLADAFLSGRAQILRYLRARGAREDAEDLLQELWLKVKEAGDRDVADPLSYLCRMAHNLMLDRHRSALRRRAREDRYHREQGGEAGDPAPGAEQLLLSRESLREIDRTLARLGARTDYIFRRYRVEGIPQRAIAEELGLTLSAVEKHLQKAYKAVAATQRAGSATRSPVGTGGDHERR